MSGILTDEQKRLIEENRQKALARRAERQKAGAACVVQNETSLGPPKCPSLAVQKSVKNAPLSCSNSAGLPEKTVPRQWSQGAKPGQEVPQRVNEVTFAAPSTKPVSGSCVMISDDRFLVEAPYHQQMIEIFRTMPSRKYDAEKKRWSFHITCHNNLMEKLKCLRPAVLVAEIPRLVLRAFSEIPEDYEVSLNSLDCKLEQALLPFQKDGVRSAVLRRGRILIADDMGLGKTIQGIAIAAYYREEWPVLVVTPSSVRFTWKEAFLRWMPSLNQDQVTVLVTGSDSVSPCHQVIITSYDLLTKKTEDLCGKFSVVLLDESHFIKNSKTARTKACQKALSKAKRVVLLTGTPALSRPIELYTQICAVQPTCFLSMHEFGIRYCDGKKNQWGWDFSGSSNMHELQLLLEKTVMIRRLKSDVLSQLPAKQRQVVLLDPSLVKTTDKLLQFMAREMHNTQLKVGEKRGVLLAYFRETGIHKVKAVCKYIEDLVEGDQKFLCFAHHQVVLDSISDLLNRKNCSYIRIDGKTSSELRKQHCDKFQYNDMCKVALLSITAANAGITLSSASLVIFAELFWNPGILTQAEDRVHRIGQQNSVVIQYLVAKGTADDYIWPLVCNKLDTLGKAGLSKDSFYDVDLKISADSKQPTLEDFFIEDEQWPDLADEDSSSDCTQAKKTKLQ